MVACITFGTIKIDPDPNAAKDEHKRNLSEFWNFVNVGKAGLPILNLPIDVQATSAVADAREATSAVINGVFIQFIFIICG